MRAYALNPTSADPLLALAESGPGYQLIHLPSGDNNIPAGKYIVFNADLLIWLDDFIQFLTGSDPQNPPRSFSSYVNFTRGIVPPPWPIASLPSIPTPMPMPMPATAPWPASLTLVATSTTSGSEVFWRLCALNPDPRLRGGALVPGTYLTSDDDLSLVTTGFGAVGRYALPSPFPASHVSRCRPASGQTFNIGTTRPNFGQSGEGVEILFPLYTVPTTYHKKLTDW